ncbi:MAG: outer membrane protein assembly factor BamD [Acidobacteria bacterium]|nr:outer membrane protein assembly factor BamD [Acidobacteriota bacterium]
MILRMENHKLLRLALPLLALALGLGGCRRHKHAQPDLAATQEPDKVLYERSLEDIQNKKYDVARLTLQTLINAYPDSDYLADAKLAIADSYYEQGGTTSLTHAEAEYKDYITFFPNSEKAAYAQYRAAMCHYRQLEKPDRDRSHARRAEEEFQLLLLNFRDSEYAKEGEQRLVQVQELLADSEFRVGRFYFIRYNPRAAASRFSELVERYPNYSQRDEALWMLAQSWEQTRPGLWNPDPEKAAETYARLIREHPASPFAEDARAELARLGHPAPEPDPVLLAQAQSVQPIVLSEDERKGLLSRMFSLVSARPDLSAAAARLGPPPLERPQQTPELPPPPIRSLGMQGGASGTSGTTGAAGGSAGVAVQTLEEMPAGTVVGTQPGEGKPKEGETQAKPGEKPQQQQQQPQPPKKKKSFWRKIVPFI